MGRVSELGRESHEIPTREIQLLIEVLQQLRDTLASRRASVVLTLSLP
jgi:hypothetical protein